MEQHEITVTDTVDEEIDNVIAGGLNRFNDEVVGYADRRDLAVLVRNPDTGKVLGGATGRSSLGLAFLEIFFLPAALRGRGIGSEVLGKFEEEARRRGCRAAVLYTISFQAPGFYEKYGWRRVGEVACDPPGTSRIFLSKTL